MTFAVQRIFHRDHFNHLATASFLWISCSQKVTTLENLRSPIYEQLGRDGIPPISCDNLLTVLWGIIKWSNDRRIPRPGHFKRWWPGSQKWVFDFIISSLICHKKIPGEHFCVECLLLGGPFKNYDGWLSHCPNMSPDDFFPAQKRGVNATCTLEKKRDKK